MLLLFAATFACWAWAWREAATRDEAWRRQPRACWSPFEPTLWGEALFSAAACMAYVRVIYWYQVRSVVVGGGCGGCGVWWLIFVRDGILSVADYNSTQVGVVVVVVVVVI